jgi:hypothetical protein
MWLVPIWVEFLFDALEMLVGSGTKVVLQPLLLWKYGYRKSAAFSYLLLSSGFLVVLENVYSRLPRSSLKTDLWKLEGVSPRHIIYFTEYDKLNYHRLYYLALISQ